MKLFLVRHGHAVAGHVDKKRPLSARGIADTKKIAAALRNQHPGITRIIHSTKVRARQTAALIQTIASPQTPLEERSGLSPDDPVDPIVEEIASRNEDLMIVGHMPFLGYLTGQLIVEAGKISFSTSTVAILERDKHHHWRLIAVLSLDTVYTSQGQKM